MRLYLGTEGETTSARQERDQSARAGQNAPLCYLTTGSETTQDLQTKQINKRSAGGNKANEYLITCVIAGPSVGDIAWRSRVEDPLNMQQDGHKSGVLIPHMQ